MIPVSLARQPWWSGFLGVADANDLVRIYLDLSFRTYLEMPAKKSFMSRSSTRSNESQPTKILVATDSPLKLVRTVEASLIEGSIVSAYPVTPPVATGNVEGVPGRFPRNRRIQCVSPNDASFGETPRIGSLRVE